MDSLEGQLELLNTLANLGHKRDDWNVIILFACDGFRAHQNWVLQFPAKNHSFASFYLCLLNLQLAS